MKYRQSPGAGSWRRLAVVFLLGLLTVASLPKAAGRVPTQPTPTGKHIDRGLVGLKLQLRKLPTTASVLHIGAHPDDEDSALIARLARGDGARVAYLSLTRGEGGQNILGTEQGTALGVIRTEELHQARAIDGGEQFFTRAFDFGFSKTLKETEAKWTALHGPDAILMDMVRVIRDFKPLVIVSRWGGTPRDGHGHHQYCGFLTPQAFTKAGDPDWHPELGPAWQAQKLYVSADVAPPENTNPVLSIPTGVYDPLLGRTYFQIAMRGRSQHKSQEMGALEPDDERFSSVKLVESRVPTDPRAEISLFDGLDTSLQPLLPPDAPDELRQLMQSVEVTTKRLAETACATSEAIGPLATAYERLALCCQALNGQPTADQLKVKQAQVARAVMVAAGFYPAAVSDAATVTEGQVVTLTFSRPIKVEAPGGEGPPLVVGGVSEVINACQAVVEPRLTADGYWQSARITLPSTPVADLATGQWVTPIAHLRIRGQSYRLALPVEYRYADPIHGEVSSEVSLTPALSVRLTEALRLVSRASGRRALRVSVAVTNHTSQMRDGTLTLTAPDGWRVQPATVTLKLPSKSRQYAVFQVSPPVAVEDGRYPLTATVASGGSAYEHDVQTLTYPHIQTRRLYPRAQGLIVIADVNVAPVTVGYVMGSGDRVPQSIEQLGLPVTLLDADALATGDLQRFDVIVVGVRASQTRPDFAAEHARLLAYVEQGGTLIVQYQRPDYAARGLPPFPVGGMTRRTTDETAKVTVLQPDHPVLTRPNRITDADWNGWVQERSLYDFSQYDPRYTPLIESHDEGEVPNAGGLVVAELGRGTYVYTGCAWFRQLPAGVPGAYRVFANLLSLPKSRHSSLDAPDYRQRPARGRSPGRPS
ncbi:PIG-L family deacetylase [Chloracidobacterium validum]|uniref:PIG-L family deacetylase n=1 Tax=Chloracidobacterium validum TaxID=2821543 RepID=A0ABX8B9B0_9BACT|nr:PIG-L family deacetylase [Chloracidobacterium validum]QUW03517.1 PIG-L family deacetylase [Chloracidobacterium validum]